MKTLAYALVLLATALAVPLAETAEATPKIAISQPVEFSCMPYHIYTHEPWATVHPECLP